ncbi:MAG TPA: hypothetical protein VJP45_10440 [Candidatus Limnocylindria bacterium]|nr:hypothetical protein [Candidatus Limnocylindria bacterium]
MNWHAAIEERIATLDRLIAQHESNAEHHKGLGQLHRVVDELALARGYAQGKQELRRLQSLNTERGA